jgi:FixJ family two-component response regulator
MEKYAGSRDEGQGAPTVHLVDDDVMVATALGRLLRSHGYEVVLHAHGQAFLDAWRPGLPACAIVDVAMPVMDGLALQGRLLEMPERPALIFLSGLGNIPVCATAMRRGAADFLTKPVDEESLLAALRLAFQREAEAHAKRESRRRALEHLASLTQREHQVLEQVAQGRLNKQIAYQFGIAEKTVKVHRARGMDKMGVRSVAQLVRLLERNVPSGDNEGSTLPGPLAGGDLRPLRGDQPASNGAAAFDH